jgi:hypothetical protein
MSTETKKNDEAKKAKLEKNIQLVKLLFMVFALLATLAFIGLLISMAVMYGLDVSADSGFESQGANLSGRIGIPMFGVIVVCAIVVGIIELRDTAIKEEEEHKQFKLVEEVEEENK